MAPEILVDTGLGNGLLPDGTKPLPESMFLLSVQSGDIQLGEFSQQMLQIISILDMR